MTFIWITPTKTLASIMAHIRIFYLFACCIATMSQILVCWVTLCFVLSVVVQNVTMLSVIMLNVIVLIAYNSVVLIIIMDSLLVISVIMRGVTMQNVVLPSVVKLNVMCASFSLRSGFLFLAFKYPSSEKSVSQGKPWLFIWFWSLCFSMFFVSPIA